MSGGRLSRCILPGHVALPESVMISEQESPKGRWWQFNGTGCTTAPP